MSFPQAQNCGHFWSPKQVRRRAWRLRQRLVEGAGPMPAAADLVKVLFELELLEIVHAG